MMQKILLSTILILSALCSCHYGELPKYVDTSNIPSDKVLSISVSPSSAEMHVDTEFPQLKAILLAKPGVDTTIIWSSDKPEILKTDPQTGKLSWGTPQNATVKIRAASKNHPEIYGECIIEIENTNGKYRYIDLRAQLGLWMLDRNLGANAPYTNPTGGDPARDNATFGNFYHFGKNDPAANREVGGNDGRGGPGPVYNVNGGYKALDVMWDGLKVKGRKEWEKGIDLPAENLKGWRLPTKKEMEKLAYYSNPDNFYTSKEKKDAIYLRKKLFLPYGGVLGGYDEEVGYGGNKYFWRSYSNFWCGFFWTSDINPQTNRAWVVVAPNTLSDITSKIEVIEVPCKGTAIPIRLVKDAQ